MANIQPIRLCKSVKFQLGLKFGKKNQNKSLVELLTLRPFGNNSADRLCNVTISTEFQIVKKSTYQFLQIIKSSLVEL